MSTVQRFVYIDPIEPSPLSLRVPSGMETLLALTYFNAAGALLGSDVAAQLELTGRSGPAVKQIYSVPATDVVNGKAQALIPAGDLSDPNGYRLNLYGTVDGGPQLLATGKVETIAAAGPQAVPPDIIDQIPLVLSRSDAATLVMRLWQDAGKTTPYDLNSVSVQASILAARDDLLLVSFAISEPGPTGQVQLDLTLEQVAALPDSCWWSIVVGTTEGTTTLVEGPVTVTA
jgi:hypothetical protein